MESRRKCRANPSQRRQAKLPDKEALFLLQVFCSRRRRSLPADHFVLRRDAAAQNRRASPRRLHRLRCLQGKGIRRHFYRFRDFWSKNVCGMHSIKDISRRNDFRLKGVAQLFSSQAFNLSGKEILTRYCDECHGAQWCEAIFSSRLITKIDLKNPWGIVYIGKGYVIMPATATVITYLPWPPRVMQHR